ncbi:MAG: hypothetical protein SFU99_19710 [Saprospiraceae bacterium]|nr:hypothetical protein [Saprospiraceae bacterium]
MSFKEYLRNLTILHLGLLAGQVFFMAIIYFLFNADEPPLTGAEATGQIEVYIIGLLTIACVLASSHLFRTRVRALKEENDLTAKLSGYRATSILRYALLEGPSLMAIIFYLIGNNLILLIFSAMIIVLFLVYRPTKERLVADLELSASEQAKLNDPNAIVM